jgi:membrane fusion protein, multidrug efflux system
VAFYVPQRYLSEVQKEMAARTLSVDVTVPGHEDKPVQGELNFVDNTINLPAGTIQLRAQFANGDRFLWPGQFVNTILTLRSRPGAVVIPSQAVSTGQKGQYVYVVEPNQIAEYREVVTSLTVDGQAVIDKGVRAGETVVTDGQLRLANGVPIHLADTPSAPKGKGP